ncbi:MAG: GHMP kinase [Verrucomicrobiae bacterium]|nr:GHMP kinase [Verrucomicrobiae bacterium]
MIISSTPLRMSFVGGGSDLPIFYRQFGGAVVSTAINQYVYVTVNPKFDHKIRLSYSQTEEVDKPSQIEHPLVREALKKLRIPGGIEITSIADIPSKGTGLGSSSAFTVGLLNALHAYLSRHVSASRLAEESCEIEIEHCGAPIGKQDQYASAFGGLNFIQFNPDDSVRVEPIICPKKTLIQLQDNLLTFYTGVCRSASEVLQAQQNALKEKKSKQSTLKAMVKLAFALRKELQNNHLSAFGKILDENWQLKRSLTPHISTSQIDHWYQQARQAGALGGKLLGAGSGGFLTFYAPKEKHSAIKKKLKSLRSIPFRFESQGSRIIFIHNP